MKIWTRKQRGRETKRGSGRLQGESWAETGEKAAARKDEKGKRTSVKIGREREEERQRWKERATQ